MAKVERGQMCAYFPFSFLLLSLLLTQDVEPDVMTHFVVGADLTLVDAAIRQLARPEKKGQNYSIEILRNSCSSTSLSINLSVHDMAL